MLTDAARCSVVAALRQPARTARIARAVWIAWAFIVWNVVFDHTIVTAGRAYIRAATRAAAKGHAGAPAVRMDDWMRPAATRGLWIATTAGGAVLVTGLLSVRLAVRASAPKPDR
ncbi:MAG: hypothetical protein HY047_08860 [Acidobacteria bacterium]|nr:hypothetical protein [Acidobacteriota bacterium]